LLCCALLAACATATQSDDGSVKDADPVDQTIVPDQKADLSPDNGSADTTPPDVNLQPDTVPGPDKGPDAPTPDTMFWPDLLPDTTPWPDSGPDTGTTGKNCTNGKDDDSDGKIDCVDLADCGSKDPCMSSTRKLIIYEVYFGNPSYVVLRNASQVPRNVGGWKLQMSGSTVTNFILPVKTLSPGQTVAVFEFNKGGTNDINTLADIPFYMGSSSNSVVLKAPSDVPVDYVAFGSLLLSLPSGFNQVGGAVSWSGFNATTQSFYRAGMTWLAPTFYRADWAAYTKSR